MHKGINFDPNIFELQFNPPQNFAAYRQTEMDAARITSYGAVIAVPFISKRFALKRFLGLSAEEMQENEELWQEENGLSKKQLAAAAELRSSGITAGGMESDQDALGQSGEMPPEDMAGMDDAAGPEATPQA